MRSILAFCIAASLAACSTITRGGDAQVASLAQAIHDEADTFYALLAAKTAPECDLAHNTSAYDHLDAMAASLQARVAEVNGGPALARAATGLAQTLTDARESHMLASANPNDRDGVCLPAAAIDLNKGAIDRASAAIAASQSSQGDQ
jgi:hypothetical protein